MQSVFGYSVQTKEVLYWMKTDLMNNLSDLWTKISYHVKFPCLGEQFRKKTLAIFHLENNETNHFKSKNWSGFSRTSVAGFQQVRESAQGSSWERCTSTTTTHKCSLFLLIWNKPYMLLWVSWRKRRSIKTLVLKINKWPAPFICLFVYYLDYPASPKGLWAAYNTYSAWYLLPANAYNQGYTDSTARSGLFSITLFCCNVFFNWIWTITSQIRHQGLLMMHFHKKTTTLIHSWLFQPDGQPCIVVNIQKACCHAAIVPAMKMSTLIRNSSISNPSQNTKTY